MKGFLSVIKTYPLHKANSLIEERTGIVDFFNNEEEKKEFSSSIADSNLRVEEDRVMYGDWQTPSSLSGAICKKLKSRYTSPDVIVEPTCGLGSFIFSALDVFQDLKEIHGIEINALYVKELKYRLFVRNFYSKSTQFPKIYIYHSDIFTFDFSQIVRRVRENHWHSVILGNPPWVTNSRQGQLQMTNLPKKSNSQGLKGIDAITGKSNFDISEYITLKLCKEFSSSLGEMVLLLKNSVIRNLIYKQKKENLKIQNISQELIDAKREFQVNVEASTLFLEFSSDKIEWSCRQYDFYTGEYNHDFGWTNEAFVSDIEKYRDVAKFDGVSSYEWRSGVKHDCGEILELEEKEGHYYNGLGEEVRIESDRIYPLYKSADLNRSDFGARKKFVLLPQRFVGESTLILSSQAPATFSYLCNHSGYFEKRRSSIYHDKDKFAIFGIGDYSFKPYKIAVSSLYKNIHFRLLSPINGKPVMLDDTCYQLGFDTLKEANIVLQALESQEMRDLIASLSFPDAKRVITKALLMRLNIDRYNEERGVKCIKRNSLNPIVRQKSLFD